MSEHIRLRVAIAVLAATLFSPAGAPQLRPAVPVHGTLVLAMTTRDGWMVCADRRRYDPVLGDQDVVTKLGAMDGKVVVASVGAAIIDERRTDANGAVTIGGALFNATDASVRFSTTRPFRDDAGYWSALATAVAVELRQALINRPLAAGDTQLQFQSLLFWRRPDGTPSQYAFSIGYAATNQIQIVSAGYGQAPVDDSLLVNGSGEPYVFTEIVNGSDRRFDDLRRDVEIRRFLLERTRRADVSSSEARQFARRFIRISSERTKDLTATSHIGPTSDCMSVDANGVHNEP